MKTNPTSFLITKIRWIIAGLLVAAGILSKSHGQAAYYAAAYQGVPAQQAAYQREMAIYQQKLAAYNEQVAYQQKLAAYNQQLAVYNQQKAAYDRAMAEQTAVAVPTARPVTSTPLRYDGRYVAAHVGLPAQVQYAVSAGNSIQSKPYRRGGGHASVNDSAYDCSGSVSYVLIKAGLLRAPLPSTGFASYGLPGPGKYITIYVKPGEHVFMTVCGLRMDTSGGHDDEGPRWRAKTRSTAGFITRHPAGF